MKRNLTIPAFWLVMGVIMLALNPADDSRWFVELTLLTKVFMLVCFRMFYKTNPEIAPEEDGAYLD